MIIIFTLLDISAFKTSNSLNEVDKLDKQSNNTMISVTKGNYFLLHIIKRLDYI